MSFLRGEFYLEIAQGRVKGYCTIGKFGRNPNVSTDGFSAIWNGGGAYTGFNATVADKVTVTSSEASDSSDGTGLRTLKLYGLGPNYECQSEIIELNGSTSVQSELSYIRLDTAKGLQSGTLGHNKGNITIAQVTNTNIVFAVIPAEHNSTMIAAYTIPAGKTGYLVSRMASIANRRAAVVSIREQIREFEGVFQISGTTALNSVGTGYAHQNFSVPRRLEEKTDYFIEAEASTDVEVSALFDIILIDNKV